MTTLQAKLAAYEKYLEANPKSEQELIDDRRANALANAVLNGRSDRDPDPSPVFPNLYYSLYTPLYQTYNPKTGEIKVVCDDYCQSRWTREFTDTIWFTIEGDWVVCQLNPKIRFALSDYYPLQRIVQKQGNYTKEKWEYVD